jgi:hypothetical protein
MHYFRVFHTVHVCHKEIDNVFIQKKKTGWKFNETTLLWQESFKILLFRLNNKSVIEIKSNQD